MEALRTLLCVLLVFLCDFLLVRGDNMCIESLRVKLDGQVKDLKNNSILHKNTVFPNGTFWKQGNTYYGCPCLVKPCMQLCRDGETKGLTVPGRDFMMEIKRDDGQIFETVKLHDHFYALPEKTCNSGAILEPSLENEADIHSFFANGSLHFPHASTKVEGPHNFCVANNGSNLTVLWCFYPLENYQKNDEAKSNTSSFQTYLNSACMIISVVFLFLTLVAFYLTPEMKNLHGKNIACQSGCLMFAFIALIVSQLSGADSHFVVCKTFAYLNYFFLMSSFFWLNTMCFDMFWTFSDFKKMTSSLHQHEKRFKMYAIYCIIGPLLFFVCFAILDNVLDETSPNLWPGIGVRKCWFTNHMTEFLYFQGPVLLSLLANILFFSVTIYKIFKMKRDGKVLRNRNSNKDGKIEEKQRMMLYAKLFLLMGGTWLMEFISWSHDGTHWIWIPTDLINASRGVFIFIFCVWTNKKVRASLLKRVIPHSLSREVTSRSDTSSKFITVGSSTLNNISLPLETMGQKGNDLEDVPI